MIQTDIVTIRGKQFQRTWSDSGCLIERDSAVYSEAVDPAEFDRVYTETGIPVEPESTDEVVSVSEGVVTE